MKDTYIEVAQARSIIYNIYSALFCQPDEDIVRNQAIFKRLAEAYTFLSLPGADQVVSLEAASKKYSDTELLVEYSRLFIGPFKTLTPPYSSVYLGNKNSVYSEDTIWVIQFYREAGLDFNQDIHDLPDHIAVEMEFIYYLLFNEIKQISEDNISQAKKLYQYQTRFMQEHFKSWVPLLCDKIIIETENDFFRLLGENLKWFIKADKIPEFPIN
jgi:TorA maturation chaperone TorD